MPSSRPDEPFRKSRSGAPDGFFGVEAAGLRWLAAADGVSVVEPLAVGAEEIVLPYVRQRPPTPSDADAFGAALARTHRSGAPHHGSPPGGWSGDGFIATLALPHTPVALRLSSHQVSSGKRRSEIAASAFLATPRPALSPSSKTK